MPDVAVSTEIDASPEKVWDLVSDLPRMGEWSPENTGGRWQSVGQGSGGRGSVHRDEQEGNPALGDCCKVVEADRGRSFAFDVSAGLFKVARWAYRIAPAGDDGCKVTEEFTDRRNELASTVTGVVATVCQIARSTTARGWNRRSSG